MNLVIWVILVCAVVFLAFWATRLAARQDEDGLHDMGVALMEFGRAFPNEAIRDLHATTDGNVVFVRLHDNKAGFMRSMRGHYACHLIEPGIARVNPLPNGKGLEITFNDMPAHSGKFEFKSVGDAAEVSLWLLGSLAMVAPPRVTDNAQQTS